MCELFAMSSRRPDDVRRSFTELARHGGLVGPHRDGWGLAYYRGGGVELIREPAAAATSAAARELQDHPFASTIVVGHIRRATQGRLAVENTQPFIAELGGASHVFAHNGDLVGLAGDPALPLGGWRPAGETDSERAFDALLERLRPLWEDGRGVPPLARRLAVIADVAARLRAHGPANFVYADGDTTFVHAHRRNQGDGLGIRPPGAHLLCRRCAGTPAGTAGDPPQDVVLVASVPLTDEDWRPLAEGEVVALAGGRVVARAAAGATPAPPAP
jgi:glutamine amidotransferase